MSVQQWGISAFIVWHLLAVATGALPDPEAEGAQVTWTGGRVDDDWVSSVVAPTANRLSVIMEPVNETLWAVGSPLRSLTEPYRQAGALRQQWQMFTNPPRHLRYLRARHYWTTTEGEAVRATELVFPVDPEGQARLVTSFSNRFRNKAVSNALQQYFRAQREGLDAYSDALDPLLALAERDFSANLPAGAAMSRSELWYGTSPNPPPGHRRPPTVAAAHDDLISDYQAGPIQEPVDRRRLPAREAIEREADIRWELFVIHQEPR